MSSCKRIIADGIAPPLAPATILMRLRMTKKGRNMLSRAAAGNVKAQEQLDSAKSGPFTPLRNTVQLIQSIIYRVRKVGGE